MSEAPNDPAELAKVTPRHGDDRELPHPALLATLAAFRKVFSALGTSHLELLLSVAERPDATQEDHAARLGMPESAVALIGHDFQRIGVMVLQDVRVWGLTEQGERSVAAILVRGRAYPF